LGFNEYPTVAAGGLEEITSFSNLTRLLARPPRWKHAMAFTSFPFEVSRESEDARPSIFSESPLLGLMQRISNTQSLPGFSF